MGRAMCAAMRDKLGRQQFEVIIQAAASGKIVARETLKARVPSMWPLCCNMADESALLHVSSSAPMHPHSCLLLAFLSAGRAVGLCASIYCSSAERFAVP